VVLNQEKIIIFSMEQGIKVINYRQKFLCLKSNIREEFVSDRMSYSAKRSLG
jgi:hypothetical protein